MVDRNNEIIYNVEKEVSTALKKACFRADTAYLLSLDTPMYGREFLTRREKNLFILRLYKQGFRPYKNKNHRKDSPPLLDAFKITDAFNKLLPSHITVKKTVDRGEAFIEIYVKCEGAEDKNLF